MTTDQSAFLAKIITHPDDDLPRLVYADWLQEHDKKESVCPECNGHGINNTLAGAMGCHRCSPSYKKIGTGIIPGNGFAERAEFIRVQIELASNSVLFQVPKIHVLSLRKYTQENIRELAGKGSLTMQGTYLPCLSVGDYLRFQSRWDVPDSRITAVRIGGIDEPTEIEFEHENIVIPNDTIDAWEMQQLRSKESQLYRANYREWFSSIAWLLQPSWVDDRVKRGFVFLEEIQCTLDNCRTHGSSIVREHPLTKVICTDKEPLEGDGSSDWFKRGTYHWWRGIESNQERRYVIGAQIHNLLFGERQVGTITVRYPSIQAAKDDLSQALIRHAKEKK